MATFKLKDYLKGGLQMATFKFKTLWKGLTWQTVDGPITSTNIPFPSASITADSTRNDRQTMLTTFSTSEYQYSLWENRPLPHTHKIHNQHSRHILHIVQFSHPKLLLYDLASFASHDQPSTHSTGAKDETKTNLMDTWHRETHPRRKNSLLLKYSDNNG
jgi:hypothetical protein